MNVINGMVISLNHIEIEIKIYNAPQITESHKTIAMNVSIQYANTREIIIIIKVKISQYTVKFNKNNKKTPYFFTFYINSMFFSSVTYNTNMYKIDIDLI